MIAVICTSRSASLEVEVWVDVRVCDKWRVSRWVKCVRVVSIVSILRRQNSNNEKTQRKTVRQTILETAPTPDTKPILLPVLYNK